MTRLFSPLSNPVRIRMLALMLTLTLVIALGVCATQILDAQQGQPPLRPPKVKFNMPKSLRLKPGTGFNLCTGKPVPVPAVSSGLEIDTGLRPCGDLSGPPKGSMVTGGNPPYHFQLDSGGFPPIGVHLGMNGLLYGTPAAKAPLGGFQKFGVCAVDLSGHSRCEEVKLSVGGGPTGSPSHTGLTLGLVGGTVAVVGAVVASELGKQSGSSCSSLENQCSSLVNQCLNGVSSACSQVNSACTQSCQCQGYSGFNVGTGSCQ